jgi:hypothetical protein
MTQENTFKHLQRLKVLLLNDNDLKERYALLRQVKTPNGYRLPKNNNGYVAHVSKTLYNSFVKVSPGNWLDGYMFNDIFDYDGFLIDFISFFNDLKDSNHG